MREGDPILKPVYDHRDGTFGRPKYVKPKEFVIAEGLLGYTTRGMRDCYDVKIYLDPDEDLRVKWKIHRDTTRRGYRREEVLASLEKRREDAPKYMHPQRTFADIVIHFQKPQGANGSDTQLDVRHILRPTLPHPDFTPLFDGSSNAGLHLELSRDRDGKPVDVLEINGNISDQRAERIEDLLWNLIPEAGHLRDQVGRIDVANGARQEPSAGADPASRRLPRRQGGDGRPGLLAYLGAETSRWLKLCSRVRHYPRRPTRTWPTPSARSPWTRCRRPIPAIPACPWAWPTSPPCCSRAS